MSGFTIENEGVERRIVYRTAIDEVIDNFGFSMVHDNDIEGLLPVLSGGNNGIDEIRYDIQSMISLRTYLEASMSKRRLLELFQGIIKIIQGISMYLLDSTMLVYDLDCIYIQSSPFKISMMYLPVIREEYIWDVNEIVRTLFRSIIISARFVVEHDNTYVTELLNALNSCNEFTIAGFRVLLEKLDVDVYRHYGEHYDESLENDALKKEAQWGDISASYEDKVREKHNGTGFGSRITDMFRSLFGKKHSEGPYMDVQYAEDEYISGSFSGTGDRNITSGYYGTASGVAMVREDTCYADDTVMLARCPVDEGIPYLTRVSTNEMIGIDKQVFRIGKEERYADYRITDNAAISRAHAEIHIKDGICYLTDEDSLNHTYVNGKRLEGHTPEQLNSGDVIRFADEEYVFHC